MPRLYSIVSIVLLLSSLVYAAGDEDIFEVQPEIHHIFREEEKQPAVIFSLLFTALTLSPWLILIGGWFNIGYTPLTVLSQLTAGSNTRTASIIAFLASLISFEFLFYLYWTQLNLLEIIGYFLLLSVITFITGQRALNTIQKEHIK